MAHPANDPVRSEYARLAPRYDKRWATYVDRTVTATLERIAPGPGERILDVGCGTGTLLHVLSVSDPTLGLAGVDLSPEMLAVAKRRLEGAADLREGWAERLPFPDAAFDIAVSTSVLHYLPDPHAALAEMKRVLKPGGRAVVSDWCDDFLLCRLCDVFLRTFSRAHVRTYGQAECERLLARAEFRVRTVEAYKISWLWGLMTATATRPA